MRGSGRGLHEVVLVCLRPFRVRERDDERRRNARVE